MVLFLLQSLLDTANPSKKKDIRSTMVDLELSAPSFKIPSPNVDLDEDHVASISFEDLRHIAALQHDIPVETFTDIDPAVLEIAVNPICSTSTTSDEQALRHFT